MSQQKEINIASNTKVGDEPKKKINAIHGYIYQLKLLMLFLWRGISKQYSFRLGTEIKEANKFDDLVFEYDEDGNKVYLLLQAKHKLNESTKITDFDLLKDSKGDFNLIKYFLSYQNSKGQELFKNGTIKDIIICTNIGFKFNDLEKAQIKVERIIGKDDILDIECGEKQPVCYRFNQDVAILLKLELQAYNAVQLPKKKITYSDDEIEDFLDHLVFAINQPNQAQLDTIIQKDMGEEFNNITTENAYNKLFHYMLNWMIDKNSERFLSHVAAKELFDKIKIDFPISFNMKDNLKLFNSDNITSIHINHALSVWNYSKKLEKEFWDLTDYIRCALQKSSKFKDVYEFEKNILCNVSQDSSTALNNLAWALMKQGKYDMALKKLNNALLIQKKFKPNNDKLLVIKCHISYVLVAQSKYDEALKNYEDVLVARKNKLGIEHDDTLYVQHEIAKIWSYKGEHEKALQILENILNILKLRCGANDSKIYATKGVMAEVYCKQGKYDESLEIFQNIYNGYTVEKNHEAFLHKWKNIAKIYLLQSEFNDALRTYQKVLKAEISIFGEDHPDVLNTRHITEALRSNEKKLRSLYGLPSSDGTPSLSRTHRRRPIGRHHRLYI